MQTTRMNVRLHEVHYTEQREYVRNMPELEHHKVREVKRLKSGRAWGAEKITNQTKLVGFFGAQRQALKHWDAGQRLYNCTAWPRRLEALRRCFFFVLHDLGGFRKIRGGGGGVPYWGRVLNIRESYYLGV